MIFAKKRYTEIWYRVPVMAIIENEVMVICVDNQRRISENDICSEYRLFSTVNQIVEDRARDW